MLPNYWWCCQAGDEMHTTPFNNNPLPGEKIWENFPMAPVTALECRCPTQPLMLSASRRLHPFFCSAEFRIIAQLGIVSDCRRERNVCFRICWGATSSWFFQEWKPYIFISPLRTSQCWMLFAWSLNSWKRAKVFSKWLIYQLIFQQDRAANRSFISKL